MSFRVACAAMLLTAAGHPAHGQAPPAEAPPAARIESGSHLWLGVFLGDAVDGGVQILDVLPDGPAYRAGLAAGDVLIRVDAAEVADRDALRRALAAVRPGQSATLTVLRGGRSVTASIAPAAAPSTVWGRRLPSPEASETPSAEAPRRSWVEGATPLDPAAWAGVTVEEIPSELRAHLGGTAEAGLLVTRVVPERPAAGVLKPGDLLLRVQGLPVATTAAFDSAVRAHAGGAIRVEGLRDGRRFAASIATPLRSPEALARDRRIRALEGAIRELEGTLDGLKRELDGLKAQRR